MKPTLKQFFLVAFCFVSRLLWAAEYREYPIGDPVEKNNLKIAAVYFPAVAMVHTMTHSSGSMNHDMMGTSQADIDKEKFVQKGKELLHIEADIHATTGNPNGFGAGEWIPYLDVDYKLAKEGDPKAVLQGKLVPMVAKDGPHYGTTLRMPGKGKYKLSYKISAPQLGRHSDPVTGVAEFWKDFDVGYTFEYNGIEK